MEIKVREPLQITDKKKERSLTIDAIKGMAIVLVVVGHCLQFIYQPKSFDQNIIFRIIYSFHMPLFMFISGFLTYNKKRELDLKWIKTRAEKLALPFVVWIFIDCLIKTHSLKNIGNIIKKIIKSPDSALWFIWILFLNCCILAIVVYLSKKIGWVSYLLIAIICGFIWMCGIPAQINYLGMHLVVWHFPFFLMGYLIHQYYWLVAKYLKHIFFICLIGFVLAVGFWNRVELPTFMPPIYEFAQKHNIPKFFADCIRGMYIWIVPILGIGQSCLAMLKLKNTRLKKILAYLGQYTMEIYILHFYVISLVRTTNILFNTIIGIIVGLAVPIIISKIIEKSIILSFLLFGKRIRK